MKPTSYKILAPALAVLFAASAFSRTQSAPSGQILDPATVAWPRTFTADGYDMAIFQPQISTWKGNELAGRFAVGIRSAGSKDEAYGVVSFTARTEIDKPNRLVTLEDLEIGKVNFPTESAKEAEYLALLKKHLVSLDIPLWALGVCLARKSAGRFSKDPLRSSEVERAGFGSRYPAGERSRDRQHHSADCDRRPQQGQAHRELRRSPDFCSDPWDDPSIRYEFCHAGDHG
jgi:hypothetical protein